MPAASPFATTVDSFGVLAFDGPDAAAFLHGQLSTDVAVMSVGAVAFTTYNSAKGRVLATLVLHRRSSDSFAGLVATDLVEALRKRLSMYVLRAKLTVTAATPGMRVVGIGGDGGDAALGRVLEVPSPGRARVDAAGEVIHMPDGRIVVIAPPAATADLLARLALGGGAPQAFERLGIEAGAPVVTLATQDRFVLQALNGDLLGAVNFRKGCYPGQEIVARMQYLGRLKERLFAFHADAAAPAPGTPLYAEGTPDAAAGCVVNAAPAGNGSVFLAVAQHDAAVGGGLRLGAPAGPALVTLALPYAIPAPVAVERIKL